MSKAMYAVGTKSNSGSPLLHALFFLTMWIALSGCGEAKVTEETSAQPNENGNSGVEQTGSISGQIGDREGVWVTFRSTTGAKQGSTSSFSSHKSGAVFYTLQGHERAVLQTRNSVSISFHEMNDNLVRDSGAVKYFPESSMWPMYEEQYGSVSVELASLDRGDDVATLSGRMFGTVYKKESITAEPDLNDKLEVDFGFEATAYKR